MAFNDKILIILKKINFAERFKEIQTLHDDFENRLKSIDKKIVIDIFKKCSYNVKFIDNCYTFIFETSNKKIHFILNAKGGIFSCSLAFKFNDEYLDLSGGSFVWLAREEKGESFEIKNANFKSYEELEQIIIKIMPIYEDLKKEIINEFLD